MNSHCNHSLKVDCEDVEVALEHSKIRWKSINVSSIGKLKSPHICLDFFVTKNRLSPTVDASLCLQNSTTVLLILISCDTCTMLTCSCIVPSCEFSIQQCHLRFVLTGTLLLQNCLSVLIVFYSKASQLLDRSIRDCEAKQ